ncbi:MAG: Binding-protein-dependent transport system inner rane component [Chloroflexi bacterium]|nr:Binding-protein-dependent transport system inner rane component [Chloroflexota bacterium]
MKGYAKYFGNKLVWFIITFIAAFLLNFFLPRMMPGDPVAAIVARMAQGQSNASGVQAIYKQYTELFGGRRSKNFNLVDSVSAITGDHRWLSDWEHTGRVSGLPQGRL